MKKFTLILLMLCAAITYTLAQANTRRLPSIINHPSFNLSAPYISLDGNAILFISDDGEDGSLVVSYSSRESDWIQPVILPKHVNHRITYLPGYALSADGKRVFFTAAKSPIIGGYDIMTSDLKGTTWSEPQNLGIPINSKTNDGSPSFTPDNSAIYFMRCEKMNQSLASGCAIFSSKKKPNGQWEEPIALPASINTGNSQTPRIMADGATLIFSSDKIGASKGGMDLFVTKLKDGNWADPIAMDFVNTAKNDQFVSVAALGRYLIKETPGSRKTTELVEFLIPEAIRPRGVMKVEGSVKASNNSPVPAYIAVTDVGSGKRVFSGRPNADGNYMFYLMEGARYEMSVDPEQNNMTYYSRQIDLTGEKILQKERVNVILGLPVAGDELPLNLVEFKPATTELKATSHSEIKRLMRIAKANPELLFEIQVSMTGYRQDSLRSDPDLTEIRIDSVVSQLAHVDSLGVLTKRDTVFTKELFHNDRTANQAQAILDFIVKTGGDSRSFSYKTMAIPASPPDERKVTVKAVARQR
ncbi:MAG: hypothetical protein WKF87_01390 [Chryseolinea sp.]